MGIFNSRPSFSNATISFYFSIGSLLNFSLSHCIFDNNSFTLATLRYSNINYVNLVIFCIYNFHILYQFQLNYSFHLSCGFGNRKLF